MNRKALKWSSALWLVCSFFEMSGQMSSVIFGRVAEWMDSSVVEGVKLSVTFVCEQSRGE